MVTNAAGALDPEFRPGDIMLIEDQLNFTGASPLTGPNDDAIGLRFPDMSRAYDPELRDAARRAAEAAGVALRYGIYAGVAGPQLETSAERRFLRASGADAVGMSTVIEVIAAVHAGMRVIGLSAITNDASGGPDQAPDTIEEVLAHAETAASGSRRCWRGCCRRFESLGRGQDPQRDAAGAGGGPQHEPLVRVGGDPARDRRRGRHRARPRGGAVERGADRLRDRRAGAGGSWHRRPLRSAAGDAAVGADRGGVPTSRCS